jgi:hypothetical protein
VGEGQDDSVEFRVTTVVRDPQQQAVMFKCAFDCDGQFPQLNALEDKLITAIKSADVGEFDGNNIGEGELRLYMYGADAEKLFAVIAPILREDTLTRWGTATIRLGPPGAKSRSVSI